MSDQKPVILFVDDEPAFAQRYLEELRKQFEVIYVADASEALEVMRQRLGEIRALVIDVMMPTPEGVSDTDTDDGFETGLWLLQQFRGYPAGDWRMGVIVLTNRRTDLIRDGLRRRGIDEQGVQIYRKIDMPAFALPRRVKGLIESVKR